jgi:hypothetical protein
MKLLLLITITLCLVTPVEASARIYYGGSATASRGATTRASKSLDDQIKELKAAMQP